MLDGLGPYRLTGTVGSTDDPPRAVKEAVFRLVEYFKFVDETAKPQRYLKNFQTNQMEEFSDNLPDVNDVELSSELHSPTWIARALQNSGAADLLRPYRNLGAG